MTHMTPIYPGEILKEEFMVPLAMSANALSKAISVPPNRVSAIVAGRRAITADTAPRLSRFFGTSPEFWMNLQSHYELECAQDKARRRGSSLSKALRAIEPLTAG